MHCGSILDTDGYNVYVIADCGLFLAKITERFRLTHVWWGHFHPTKFSYVFHQMYRCSKKAWSNLPRHVRKAYYCLLEQRQYYINPSVWNRHQNHYFQWKRRRNCDNRRALKTWIEVILVTFCESFHYRQLERSIQSILLSCHQSIIKKRILKDFLAKNFFSSFIKSVQVKKKGIILI